MNKVEKTALIEQLAGKFADSKYFYITDHSTLTVEKTNELREACFKKDIQLKVVKNSLIRKALEKAAEENNQDYSKLYDILKGFSAIMFTETGNAPAKLIKELRDQKQEKPILKAAYIDSDVFVGDDQVEALVNIKSKEDLIADVISLLQAPMQNLMGALQSGGNTITGLLKALEEREG